MLQAKHTFSVRAALPEKLEKLRQLAYNLYWCWNHDVIDLFRRIDRDLWEEVESNPVLLLGRVPQKRLESIAEDDAFQSSLDRVYTRFKDYMDGITWYDKNYRDKLKGDFLIAYFSAEFGISESLPIYSGGLGILAGDHLKSSSDLGIPLVGVGLLYQQGYFRQYLNVDGWQQEEYPENDFYNIPVEEVMTNGQEMFISVDYPGRKVYAKVWKIQVGRVSFYLLDTNVHRNSPHDRKITYQLYGGDRRTRLEQEIMLGIGGVRMLQLLGLEPTVCHMNEGHAGFLVFERVKFLIEKNALEPKIAIEAGAAGNIFTTHTPVPAGFDVFPLDLMNHYFGPYAQKLKISMEELLSLGRGNIFDAGEEFNMAVLALKNAGFTNGVSRLHGSVSRKLFNTIIPSIPENETPVSSVTNGIHIRSWLSKDMEELLFRYLGECIFTDPSQCSIWQRVADIPADELWIVHQRRKEKLINYARRQLRKHMLKSGSSAMDLEKASEALSPFCLTIGFARRFATYKRASLILEDTERIEKIVKNKDMPVQFIFAGKAHPKDEKGKELIRKIVHFSRREGIRKRFIFIEDYNIKLARYLVSGVDVWLNNPLRPMEASGTSGMKVVINGGLNLSVLDGWWDEAYQPGLGWAIGKGEVYNDPEYQRKVESDALYDLIENEIAPIFFMRDAEGLPRKWIELMKNSLINLAPYYNTNRMVREYFEHFYLPTSERYERMTKNNFEKARNLSAWRDEVFNYWQEVSILDVTADKDEYLRVGDKFEVTARVHLGQLEPKNIRVDAYNGLLNHEGKIVNGYGTPLTWSHHIGQGNHVFKGYVFCRESGKHGFTIRVLPTHEDLPKPLGFFEILWE
jgi:starch phosphorylase